MLVLKQANPLVISQDKYIHLQPYKTSQYACNECLIVLFVVLSQYEAIGFLIAAKSILRFSEATSGSVKSEYVLTGTLLSLTIALCLGLVAVKWNI